MIRAVLSATVSTDVESVALEMSCTDIMVAKALTSSIHVPCMDIAVFVSKRGKTSTIARSAKTRRLNTATKAAKAVVKDKLVLNSTEAAESTHMSLKGVIAHKSLLQSVKTACCV